MALAAGSLELEIDFFDTANQLYLSILPDNFLFTDGANRFNLPQWLILAMTGSGLWAEDLLPQVQGVAYLHMNKTIDGGNFFFYPDG